MDVRAQVSMVFHLDKCIGCHTCSVSCKNVWTDRRGAEYMWWNNVESRPGTGYPTLWEDQEKYRGGWEKRGRGLELRLQGRAGSFANLFFNPYLPTLDDYYEPWTYRYADLFAAPPGDDQPTARPISQITGKPIDIEAGPNWDDDLGGSAIYAAGDPSLGKLSEEERSQIFALERIFCFYLPRICNHCLNPSCIASCPAGAIYKRGEDGIVLVSQEKCRAWRMCISGCPYKKVYYNWESGKSEKCILCYPRVETGQAPACFHSCVGRIRYQGVLLYDAGRIEEAANAPAERLVAAQREVILDPSEATVVAAARRSGVPDAMIDAARKSPVYRFVKEFRIALPLHPEFRTVPMLFYVPPLLPVVAFAENGRKRLAGDFFSSLESARVPVRYLASLLSAGNETVVTEVLTRIMAVRIHRKAKTVGEEVPGEAERALSRAGISSREAEEIYRLTSLPAYEDRFVIPPAARESAIESFEDPFAAKGETGIGFLRRRKGGKGR
ncbi:MAG: respiratory nitrate reductase subunit beta, nitrate reductase 1, beta subunit [Deltaproteobacteria bacterium CSP1-8]|nr:MAG: respiratory nitrate reductase subunit beta, nitrate reductase 1, beta subunit [Deltaproteobacteria bacterium CSP1-8]